MAAPAAKPRLVALDVARGVTMVFMMMVDNQGSGTAVYWPFLEADWEGFGPAVTVFPTFLFLAGCSLVLALTPHSYEARKLRALLGREEAADAQGAVWFAHRWFCPRRPPSSRLVVCTRIIYRAAKLFAFGALLNLWAGNWNFAHWVYFGVLQRIAICYSTAALLFVLAPAWVLPLSAAAAVTAWTLIMYMYDVPGCPQGALLDPFCNAAAYIDRTVLGPDHVPGAYLPEGLVSTLTAYGTLVLGVVFGMALRALKSTPWRLAAAWLAGSAMLGGAAGAVSQAQPLIKKIWTPAFALAAAAVSGGLCVAALLAADVPCGRRRRAAGASWGAAAPGSALDGAAAPLLGHPPSAPLEDPCAPQASDSIEGGAYSHSWVEEDPSPHPPSSAVAACGLPPASASHSCNGGHVEMAYQTRPAPASNPPVLAVQQVPSAAAAATVGAPAPRRRGRSQRAWCLPGFRGCVLTPFVWLGRNAAVVFIGMVGLEILLMDTLRVSTPACWAQPPPPPGSPCPPQGRSPWAYTLHLATQATRGDLEAASSLVALVHSLFWTAVTAVLYRCGVFVVM